MSTALPAPISAWQMARVLLGLVFHAPALRQQIGVGAAGEGFVPGLVAAGLVAGGDGVGGLSVDGDAGGEESADAFEPAGLSEEGQGEGGEVVVAYGEDDLVDLEDLVAHETFEEFHPGRGFSYVARDCAKAR